MLRLTVPTTITRFAQQVSAVISRRSELFGYLAALALCLIVLVVTLKLWRADLAIPIAYSGDGLITHRWIQSIYEEGWYLHSDRLGAPAGSDLHDFPMADSLHFLVIKGLCAICSNSAMVYNVFYLLTFPLIMLTSLYALRCFRISFPLAIAGSLLFAFHNYHLYRGLGHLFLGAYYVVPLSVLLMLRVYAGEVVLWRGSHSALANVGDYRRKLLGGVLIAALQSSAGVYFAFFACYLLMVAGLAASWREKKWQGIVTAGLLISITTVGVALNTVPSVMYRLEHGKNVLVAGRLPVEAEMYALRITHMLFPQPNHRIAALAKVRQQYDRMQVLNSESSLATLGLFAGSGFIVLCAALLLRNRNDEKSTTIMDGLCTLNAAALLLGTFGGFGAIFNLLVTPQIRCYNRISIFIAFFGLLAMCWLAQQLVERWEALERPRWVVYGLVALLCTIGMYDQVPRHFAYDYRTAKIVWQHDADFFQKLEAVLPEQGKVFQYPYMSFPESPPVHAMTDYQHLRGFLHTRDARWSYGVMRGRDGDLWLQQVDKMPLPEQLQTLVVHGFQGVYIDRRGYPDNGVALEAQIAELTDQTPIVSLDQTMAFYDLRSLSSELKAKLLPTELEQLEVATSVSSLAAEAKRLK